LPLIQAKSLSDLAETAGGEFAAIKRCDNAFFRNSFSGKEIGNSEGKASSNPSIGVDLREN
jgi:hypothetical protein